MTRQQTKGREGRISNPCDQHTKAQGTTSGKTCFTAPQKNWLSEGLLCLTWREGDVELGLLAVLQSTDRRSSRMGRAGAGAAAHDMA